MWGRPNLQGMGTNRTGQAAKRAEGRPARVGLRLVCGVRCLGLSVLAVVLGLRIGVSGGEARACSVPCQTWILPAGGTVPANLPVVRWRTPMGDEGTLVVTEVLPDGTASEVPMDVEAQASDYGWRQRSFGRPLIVGATYIVSVESWCSEPSKRRTDSVHLVAGPEAPLPTKLGRVTVSGAFRAMCEVLTSSGSCWSTADVSARRVHLELSDEAEPWREALDLSWRTRDGGWLMALPQLADNGHEVDGDPLSLTAYSLCASSDVGQYAGNPEGKNEVFVTATLPGTEVALETRSVDVTLRCGADETPAATCLAVPSDGGCAGG
ncbi:MAG TPA: hypothetical protein PK095_17815, partial [Myxococcota bacterium]|nr:hypothetical protein [Myxococcota bacterium]